MLGTDINKRKISTTRFDISESIFLGWGPFKKSISNSFGFLSILLNNQNYLIFGDFMYYIFKTCPKTNDESVTQNQIFGNR